MKTKLIVPFIMVIVLASVSCRQLQNPSGVIYSFSLKDLAQRDTSASLTKSNAFSENVLSFTASEENNEIVITDGSDKISWDKARYLVCDIYHANDYCAIIYIDFYKNSGDLTEGLVQQGAEISTKKISPRISPKIGILPLVKTRMIFPLSYLDGQNIFLDRFPRQLKGTVMGRRLDPAEVGKVSLRVEPSQSLDFATKIEIAGIYLYDTIPPSLADLNIAVVDEFGQWTMKNWEGKTMSEEALRVNLQNLEKLASAADFPSEWSSYGGWKQLKFNATGYFHTHNDGKRWWLADPEGYAFLSAGVDCIRENIDGSVKGQEDMFAWLPDREDSLFAPAYSKRRGNSVQYDFLKSNMIRVYGKDYISKWDEITSGLLRLWRVNTIANWSDLRFAKKASVPYVLNMSGYPVTKVLLYRDFPDVFSEEYAQNAVHFAKQLENFKDDKYLIGYFMSNEPHWAFGDNNLAFEMFATNTQSFTKTRFIGWLKEKYKTDITEFNKAWNQNLDGFEAISSLILKESPSDLCWKDCTEFSGLMVDQYVKQVCDEVKKVDNNHLNLGMRYAWISSELCYRAGAFFDVFSINGYSYPGPPETAEIAKRSGKPVIIGEYHFGSTDRGLPATGIQGAENQYARGQAYRYYIEQGFARPELIGIHYFQWMDQPVFGRFDGENYNIGFLDICMHPYTDLTNQAKLSHEKMYRVATGAEKAYDTIIKRVPQIYF